MAVDGTFNIEVQTAIGNRPGTLTLNSDGGSLTGTYLAEMGEQAIQNGTVAGDQFAFSVAITTPMGEMKLDFQGTVSGNTVSGQVQAGQFGVSPFQGARA